MQAVVVVLVIQIHREPAVQAAAVMRLLVELEQLEQLIAAAAVVVRLIYQVMVETADQE
jgi:hypothetical protein